MAEQNVKAFFEKVHAYATLRAKLKAVSGEDRESTVKAIVEMASKMGLPFTAEEYARATASHAGPPKPRRQ